MIKGKIVGGIVTYNNEDTIQGCIESILKYTQNCGFKLWVYDNCSSDHTVDIIEKNFPEVNIIKGEKNIGFGGGHNSIVKKSKSDVYAIINPDIFIKNDVISEMAEYMDLNKDVVQMTVEVRNMDDTIQYLPKEDPSFKYVILSKFKRFKKYRSMYTREFDVFKEPSEILSSTGCFSMVRTNTFKKIHGYDRRFFLYFEDADLSRRLRTMGKIIYHPDMYVYHAWKRDNTKNIKGICRFLISMCKYFAKWR